MGMFKTSSMLRWLWITIAVIALDQITKQWAVHSLAENHGVAIMPMLNLFLAYNPGAAFSFLAGAGPWGRWLLTLLALGVSVGLVMWLRKLHVQERGMAIGLTMILGGALGNVIDRILFGHVIDFIQFYYQGQSCLIGFTPFQSGQQALCIWPSFNIADSAISVGAAILILDGLIGLKRKRHDAPSTQEAKHG